MVARGLRILFGVTEMLYFLFLVVVTWAYSLVKTDRTIHLRVGVFLFYVLNASIKFF